jgi:hypothetical protein
MVDSPIVNSAATSVVLRPMRSPKCPNSAEPIGRARNAIANVASEASGRRWVRGREEQPRKYQHSGRRIDVEVEELDRRADEAGKEEPAWENSPALRPRRAVWSYGRRFYQATACPDLGFSAENDMLRHGFQRTTVGGITTCSCQQTRNTWRSVCLIRRKRLPTSGSSTACAERGPGSPRIPPTKCRLSGPPMRQESHSPQVAPASSADLSETIQWKWTGRTSPCRTRHGSAS